MPIPAIAALLAKTAAKEGGKMAAKKASQKAAQKGAQTAIARSSARGAATGLKRAETINRPAGQKGRIEKARNVKRKFDKAQELRDELSRGKENNSEGPDLDINPEDITYKKKPLLSLHTLGWSIYLFPIAITFDVIGIILFAFALDDFFILDVAGFILLTIPLYFRSRRLKIQRGAKERLQKKLLMKIAEESKKGENAGKYAKMSKSIIKQSASIKRAAETARFMRVARIFCRVGELIPYVGVLPLWTVICFLEVFLNR